MAKIFDGRQLAVQKEKDLAKKVARLKISPKLVNIVVGNDPASHLYLRVKEKAARRVGIGYEKKVFPADVKPQKIIDFVKQKNQDTAVAGIMFQQPFPKAIGDRRQVIRILDSIELSKDVDGLTSKSRFLPATVKAVTEIIRNSKFEIRNSTVVVIGRSNIVGKPLATHLANLGAKVTVCHSQTKNFGRQTRRADILVSATGQSKLVKKQMVKKGAVVIDVGYPQGDVDFDQVKKVASFITPVPGGVGPLTVICLLENVLQAAAKS